MTDNGNGLLTVDEVCDQLEISKATLHRKMKAGELEPTYQKGVTKPVPMFSPEQIAAYLNRKDNAIAVVPARQVEARPTRQAAPVAELDAEPAGNTLFITVKEASRRSGLPQSYLEDLLDSDKARIGVKNFKNRYISWPALVKFAENLEFNE